MNRMWDTSYWTLGSAVIGGQYRVAKSLYYSVHTASGISSLLFMWSGGLSNYKEQSWDFIENTKQVIQNVQCLLTTKCFKQVSKCEADLGLKACILIWH